MQTRPLGRSALQVSPLCFGGNVFGWTVDEAASFALLDAWVDAGFNFVDTADVYSAWAPGHTGGESETIIGRIGVGARILAHQTHADAGVNFTIGGDVFPVRPVVLSGTINLGNVGDAFLFHGRATIGIVRSRFEIYTGYDYFQIGSVPLQGPLIGLRLWF